MSKKTSKIRRNNSPDSVPDFIGVLRNLKYRLIVEGIGVGLLAGMLVSLFRVALNEVDSLRDYIIEMAGSSLFALAGGLVLLIGGAVAVAFIMKKEPMCVGSGIVHVKGEMIGKVKTNWLSVIIAKFAGGVLAIGGGLSLGRQGPSVQLGAMAGKGFSRLSGRLIGEERLLMTCGAGAGLAAAFGAPLSGVVFALEELHKNFSSEVLLSTMAASITSDWVASSIFGLKPVFYLSLSSRIPLSQYWILLIMGVLLGALGWAYNKSLLVSQKLFKKLGHPLLKGGLTVAAVIVFAIFYPSVLGSGHELVELVGGGNFTIRTLAVLLVLKIFFNVFCFGTGAPGGIFLPLLVAGAVFGGLYTQVLDLFIADADTHLTYFVALGMAGLFAAVVRAPVTGIILICEMTAIFNNMLPFAVVTLTAYVTAELMGAVPIYDQLLENMLSQKKRSRQSNPDN